MRSRDTLNKFSVLLERFPKEMPAKGISFGEH